MGRKIKNLTINEGINTEKADEFTRNIDNSANDVKLNWWAFFSTYRTKKWKNELRNLSESTGVSFDEVCSYIDVKYSGIPGFYRKLPKTRDTYIGIGMAYKQPLAKINKWLVKYGGKKKLYVKECLSDLIWIHLINSNYNDKEFDINYFEKYNECRDVIHDIYNKMNSEITDESLDTVDIEKDIVNLIFDDDYVELKNYVKENISSFNSAYAKPKALLNGYIEQILRVKNENKTEGRNWTLNSLRGYLDDSMINYLTSGIKYVPKNKKTHIAIGLALGMTVDDLNQYLDMMGYGALDSTHLDEGLLINMVAKWEETHELQRKFKNKYLTGRSDICLTRQEEMEAVNDMLRLRIDLKEAYESIPDNIHNNDARKKFPYLNE